jgi:glycosyltransferase involved in cell wall biosynthesis
MKVLTFTTLYPNNIWPNFGVFTKERAIHLAKLDGCKVNVLSPVPYFPPIKLGWRWNFSQVARQEMRDGLEVFHPQYVMTPKVGMTSYGLMMFLSVLRTAKKIQRKFDFDIIDAHYVYPDGFAAVLLGLFFRKPVVVWALGTDINLYARFPVIRKLLQYALRRSDHVIAVCQALKEAMIKLEISGEKISVIPTGVDLSKFYPFPKEDARSKLSLPLNKKIILSVGHLTPNKGFDLLIKAFKILSDKSREDDQRLVVVGEGSNRKDLEKLLSSFQLGEHVNLVGAIPHQDLFLWYNAADLFCLASEKEGWPNVLLESLACGIPVVATDVGGIPEIIRSDRVGLLTERNERDIAKNISIALKKEWDHDEIMQYAREHTWDKVAQSVYEVFQTVLNSGHSNSISH